MRALGEMTRVEIKLFGEPLTVLFVLVLPVVVLYVLNGVFGSQPPNPTVWEGLGAWVGNNFHDCLWSKKLKIRLPGSVCHIFQDVGPSWWSASIDSSVGLALRTHAPRGCEMDNLNDARPSEGLRPDRLLAGPVSQRSLGIGQRQSTPGTPSQPELSASARPKSRHPLTHVTNLSRCTP